MSLRRTCGCGAAHDWAALHSIGISMGLELRQCPACDSTLAEPLAVVSAAIGRASRGWTVVAAKAPPRPLLPPKEDGAVGRAA